MATMIDYSAARLSGGAVRAAGHSGAVRYVTAPNLRRGKHITPAEYRSYIQAGLQVLLVFEQHTDDALGGYSAGVANARLALAGANELGYKGPIFFCNDTPDLHSASLWRSYLDGAASVLGRARVGAYGFGNAMDAAVGHATYFWQAGRESDVRSFVHLYQWNNGRVYVSGIECDLNKVRRPISTSVAPAKATVTPVKKRRIDDMLVVIYRNGKHQSVYLNVGGVMYPLSAGPANNAYTRARNGELPWLAVTITELRDMLAKSKGLLA